jgi:methylisocitrate lyase
MRESRGALFRRAVAEESPLQLVGTITAYTARMAEQTGYKAIYLSGGGVAANSLGMPDLGISTMDDVITDAQRITDVCGLPLMVDIDTGWGGAFNIARTIRHMIRADVAAVHIEDQVSTKRCGHRPGKEVVSTAEMVDRIKAAVDARHDESFVIMARTDALAVEGLNAAIDRACAYVEAGADMIFPEGSPTSKCTARCAQRSACRSSPTSPNSAPRRCSRSPSCAPTRSTSRCTAAAPTAP